MADTTRPAADTATDAARDPADTLAFAGVKPGMTVAELFPGGGYYSRMLSDIVGPRGRVYGIENAGWKEAVKLDQAMAAEPGRSNFTLQVQPFGQFTLPTTVDLFWITQNYHDLHIAKYGQVDLPDFNRRVFQALKPGGVYLVIDHQANPGHRSPDRRPAPHREGPGRPRGHGGGVQAGGRGDVPAPARRRPHPADIRCQGAGADGSVCVEVRAAGA